MAKKIKAIIFDMDGVLIDAKEWHYLALNKALSHFGLEISRYEHLTAFDGLPTKKKLEMLSLDRGLPVQLHGFLNDLKQQYTIQLVSALCKPNFIHEYALSKLKSDGYSIAVCSNSVRRSIQQMMEYSGLLGYLDFFLSNQDVTHAKPSPEIYINAMRRLGRDPKECVIVEDNPNGIKAAIDSGAFVLEVASVTDVNYSNVSEFIAKCEV